MKGFTYAEWAAGSGYGGPAFPPRTFVPIDGITFFTSGKRDEITYETVGDSSVRYCRWIAWATFTRAGSTVLHGVEFELTPGNEAHAFEQLKAAVTKLDDGAAL